MVYFDMKYVEAFKDTFPCPNYGVVLFPSKIKNQWLGWCLDFHFWLYTLRFKI